MVNSPRPPKPEYMRAHRKKLKDLYGDLALVVGSNGKQKDILRIACQRIKHLNVRVDTLEGEKVALMKYLGLDLAVRDSLPNSGLGCVGGAELDGTCNSSSSVYSHQTSPESIRSAQSPMMLSPIMDPTDEITLANQSSYYECQRRGVDHLDITEEDALNSKSYTGYGVTNLPPFAYTSNPTHAHGNSTANGTIPFLQIPLPQTHLYTTNDLVGAQPFLY